MPKESDAKWYVLHTYSGYENNVATNIARKIKNNEHLQEYIYETQIPLELVSDDPNDLVDGVGNNSEDVKDSDGIDEKDVFDDLDGAEDELDDDLSPRRKRKTAKKSRVEEHKLLPSYVFVKMVLNEETQHIIRNIRGVTGFVGPDSHPVPLTDDEVINLGLGGTAKKTFEVDYEVGDSVMVVRGQFVGDIVVVKEIDCETGKVTVEKLIGGNMSTIEFDASDLERE